MLFLSYLLNLTDNNLSSQPFNFSVKILVKSISIWCNKRQKTVSGENDTYRFGLNTQVRSCFGVAGSESTRAVVAAPDSTAPSQIHEPLDAAGWNVFGLFRRKARRTGSERFCFSDFLWESPELDSRRNVVQRKRGFCFFRFIRLILCCVIWKVGDRCY